jgi:hypothetical protein
MRDVEFRNRLLLNEVKEEKLEALFFENPMDCRCCRKALKEYLSFAKGKKHSKKQVRKAVKKQLSYVS